MKRVPVVLTESCLSQPETVLEKLIHEALTPSGGQVVAAVESLSHSITGTPNGRFLVSVVALLTVE